MQRSSLNSSCEFKISCQIFGHIENLPSPSTFFLPAPPPPCLQLWEFILHHLELHKLREDIRWIERRNGTFRMLRPIHLAKMWGEYHSSHNMTYQSMSRAMRHYYKRGILEQTPGRLVYKFTDHIMHQVMLLEARGTS